LELNHRSGNNGRDGLYNLESELQVNIKIKYNYSFGSESLTILKRKMLGVLPIGSLGVLPLLRKT
jgi:hypothetical protein